MVNYEQILDTLFQIGVYYFFIFVAVLIIIGLCIFLYLGIYSLYLNIRNKICKYKLKKIIKDLKNQAKKI